MLSHGGIILQEASVARAGQRRSQAFLRETPRCSMTLVARLAGWRPEPLHTGRRELAAGQARELGLMDPEGPGSFTHLHLSRMLHADGKVVFTRAGSGRSGSTRRPGRLSR